MLAEGIAETDPTIAKRVAKIFPGEIIAVEASGISSRKDIEKGLAAGFNKYITNTFYYFEQPVNN